RLGSSQLAIFTPASCSTMARRLLLLVPLLAPASANLETVLAEVAAKKSAEYNCSISIAVRTLQGSAAVASGVSNFEEGWKAKDTDLYAWGSVTKMFTAASIMKLVGSGHFRLDDEIAPLVDTFLAKMAAQ
ncbi:unnamed protein product, partial [Effrenium voratum]